LVWTSSRDRYVCSVSIAAQVYEINIRHKRFLCWLLLLLVEICMMSRTFIPPTYLLLSITLVVEALVALVLSSIYLAFSKDKSVVYILVCVNIPFLFFLTHSLK